MGTWGVAPWENDATADWFNGVFRTTRFAEEIVRGLNASIEDDPEIVRAAGHVVFLLGHVYVWPVERLSDDLRLAADRLQRLLDSGWQPATPLRKELRAVKARLEQRTETKGSGTEDDGQDRVPAEASTDRRVAKSVLRLAWIRDLATPEQRMNASALRWRIRPPAVTLLKTTGANRLLAGTDNHLELLDVVSGQRVLDLAEPGGSYTGLSDQRLVAQAGVFVATAPERIAVRKISSGETVFAIENPGRVGAKAISPDGRLLLLLTWDGVLHVYDVERGEKRFEFKHAPPKRPECADCAVSPDGRRAVSSFEGSVCFWELESGKQLRQHRNKYAGVRLTGDGMGAITRGGTGSVLWDLESGKKIRAITGADCGPVGNQLISPDSRYVCEVAPFKVHDQRGEVHSVREWTAQDAPPSGIARIDFAWFGADRLACWRNLIGARGIATCEARLWALDPLELLGTAEVEPPLLPVENKTEPVRVGMRFFRLTADVDHKMIFAGDGNAHVYAFFAE